LAETDPIIGVDQAGDLGQGRGVRRRIGTAGIATELAEQHRERSGEFARVAGEVVEERGGEAVGALLGGGPGGAGQVVGEVVVRCGDLAGIGVYVPELERGALELNGVHRVVAFVFQVGAGAMDHGELGDVRGGVEGVVAFTEELVSVCEPTEVKQG
jgi:hypothetical protein